MMTSDAHQPTGYPTVSVYMMADGAQRVIDLMTDVLGGETLMRMDRDNGTILHAAVRIGDSVIMLVGRNRRRSGVPGVAARLCS
jgi:uncharacterized glyoxalase superfamily protein PhnB